jgi:hypothetical protein
VPTSPARSGATPGLALTWQSAYGNGDFRVGWQLTVGRIQRKTDTGIPRSAECADSDVLVLSSVDDLVPLLQEDGSPITEDASVPGFSIWWYRPRTEGSFARVERWTDTGTGEVHWRLLSPNNVLSVYGHDPSSRIADPDDPRRVFNWLLCQVRDDVGNAIVYDYEQEDAEGIDITSAPERARGDAGSPRRTANRHLKRVFAGDPEQPGEPQRCLDRIGYVDYRTRPIRAGRRGTGCRCGSPTRTGPTTRVTGVAASGCVPPTAGRRSRSGPARRASRRSAPSGWVYQAGANGVSLLSTVTVRAQADDGDPMRLPPLEFGYSLWATQARRYLPLTASNAALPDASLGHPELDLGDLFGDGLPSVLQLDARQARYWRNRGQGRLNPPRSLPATPAGMSLGAPGVVMADADGDGRADLIVTDGTRAGYFLVGSSGGFDPRGYVHYRAAPPFGLKDLYSRLINLNGHGVVDVLRSSCLQVRPHDWTAGRVSQPVDTAFGLDGVLLRDGRIRLSRPACRGSHRVTGAGQPCRRCCRSGCGRGWAVPHLAVGHQHDVGQPVAGHVRVRPAPPHSSARRTRA